MDEPAGGAPQQRAPHGATAARAQHHQVDLLGQPAQGVDGDVEPHFGLDRVADVQLVGNKSKIDSGDKIETVTITPASITCRSAKAFRSGCRPDDVGRLLSRGINAVLGSDLQAQVRNGAGLDCVVDTSAAAGDISPIRRPVR
jgi:hypothetical protein